MKLKIENYNEEEKYIEVKYFSFVKCYLASALGIAALVYGVLIVIGLLLGIF